VRSGQGTGSLSQSLKANPVYQSLQVELNRTEQQIAEQRADLAQRSARVAELQRLVNTVPEVEAQLAQLNRDYEVNRNQYQALIKTLETAKLSDQADKTGIVKFQIMEPPSVPLKPVAPNRKLLYSAVLIAALAAGFALAYVLNQIRPVFQNVRSLANITGLPVLGFVSRTWVERHRAQMRRSLFAFSGGIAALLVLFVAIATWREIGARIIQHGAG
jgi:capsular polysaccharide biosynthesis protein